tara:strand:- start:91793 stop:92092 length:300 start_codon:yes stop_codon:yes gene_type:complete
LWERFLPIGRRDVRPFIRIRREVHIVDEIAAGFFFNLAHHAQVVTLHFPIIIDRRSLAINYGPARIIDRHIFKIIDSLANRFDTDRIVKCELLCRCSRI